MQHEVQACLLFSSFNCHRVSSQCSGTCSWKFHKKLDTIFKVIWHDRDNNDNQEESELGDEKQASYRLRCYGYSLYAWVETTLHASC